MSSTAFRRARGYLNRRPGATRLSMLCGFLAGLSFVGWFILLILFVELLVDHGRAHYTGIEAAYAFELTGEQRNLNAVTFEKDKAGLLPFVVGSQGRWYGPFLDSLYRSLPWMQTNVGELVGLLTLAILLGSIRVLLLYAQQQLLVRATTSAVTDLQRAVFQHKLETGGNRYDAESERALARILREKIPAIDAGLQIWLATSVREPAKVVALIGLTLALNPLLGLCFLITATLLWILGSQVVRRVMGRRRELAAIAEDELQRLLGLSGKLRIIRGYAAEQFFQQQYDNHLASFESNNMKRLQFEGRIAPLWQFLGLLLVLIVVGLGAHNVLTEKFVLSVAAGVYGCLLGLISPLYALYRRRVLVRQANKAADQVFAFLDNKADVGQSEGQAFLKPTEGSVTFAGVTVKSEIGKVLVNNLTLNIAGKSKVALVGKNENEKKAIVYLLTRFLDPLEGRIEIDGQDLQRVTLESLRSQVCMVMQEDLLFPETVANNIGCGDPGFTLQKITEAAKLAHAHHFVQRLPHGYECVVGDAGFPLKKGESFRIALARAILRDPAIVVIEEPSEPLDEETKAALDDTLSRFCPGRTIIFLPHRMSTVKHCDQVFLIDNGRMVDSGTHRELTESSELYRHLQYVDFHGIRAANEAG